jgi:hypothetical protein
MTHSLRLGRLRYYFWIRFSLSKELFSDEDALLQCSTTLFHRWYTLTCQRHTMAHHKILPHVEVYETLHGCRYVLTYKSLPYKNAGIWKKTLHMLSKAVSDDPWCVMSSNYEAGNLLVDCHKTLNRQKNYSCQLLNVHRVGGVRHTEMPTAKSFVPQPKGWGCHWKVEKV